MPQLSQGCYLIFKRDCSGQFPMYRTTENKIALLMFRSRELAQAFVSGKGMSREWKVEEYPQAAFVEWVRNALTDYGASELAIDPDPTTSDKNIRVIPIFP